jgi:endoglucanase
MRSAARVSAVLCLTAATVSAPASSASAASELAPLHVEGNRLVDPSGRPVVLRGVNRSGTEYMCAEDLGIADGPIDQASIAAMRGWRANAVRIPLNEHCWLGVDDGAPTPAYVGEAYRQTIESYARLLVANGLYAIIDLHWSAPEGQNADRVRPMPNTSYSEEFWTSVADRFKNDGRVVFDLFNEPVPNNNQNDATDDAARRSWECWRDGGVASCDATLSVGPPSSGMSASQTVGMQSLVNAVRATGATNVILLGGIQWANTLWSSATQNWLAYRPADPLANIAAAVHVYPDTWCVVASCYEREIAPIAARVPVVAGELGIAGCDPVITSWLNTLMSWLDEKNSGYLAWTWDTPHSGHDPCAVIKLLLSYDGTPTPYGQIVRNHFAGRPVETTATLSASTPASREGETVMFTATVAAMFGADVPTGDVAFVVDGQAQTASLDASGHASVAITFADNGVHEVAARYDGSLGFDSSASVSISHFTVANVAPQVGAIAGATDPVPVSTSLGIGASFTDVGTLDSHSVAVDWGDGTNSPATVTERDGSGSFTASHAYAAAGIYRVVGAVTDDDGGVARSVLEAAVVFDPAAGSARGAGWFESPRGAHAADESATGRATFGFLARYQKDANEPVAHPGFRLKTGRLTFESTGYDWLVITGAKAQLRGSGRIDGTGSYGFRITALDGLTPGSGADRIRVEIWDARTGAVVYDTQMSAPDGADPVTPLGGGSIAIGPGGG